MMRSSMVSTGLPWLAFAMLGAALGCDSGDEAPVTGRWVDGTLDIPSLGLSITGFEEFASSAEYLDDGTVELFGDASVTIDGKGTHQVTVAEYVDAVANGARETLFVTDDTDGTERVFHYEPDDNAVVIGDAEGGVFVFQNPDGSYDVVTATFDAPASEDTYVHANDGYEAYQIVKDYNELTTSSPHSILLAYGLALTAAPESRDSGADGTGATPPVVCSVFKAFCDCVACDFSGRGTSCELCSAP